jgi:hypothetical protein
LNTYYKYTLSTITHKLHVSGHMLLWIIFLIMYVELVLEICLQLSATPLCRIAKSRERTRGSYGGKLECILKFCGETTRLETRKAMEV